MTFQRSPSKTLSPDVVSAKGARLSPSLPTARSTVRLSEPARRYHDLPESRDVSTPSDVAAKYRWVLKRSTLSTRTGKLAGGACVHSAPSWLQKKPLSVPATKRTSASGSSVIESDR